MSSNESAFEFDVIVSIVLFRTPPAEVEACLNQLLASRCRAKVIIVDNSPTPVRLAPRPADRVAVLVTGANLGYGRAHNRAIALGRGLAPFHLVMNTDVNLCGDVLSTMINFMEAHPEAGLASPMVRYPDGRLQTSCRLLPTPANTFGRGFLDRSRWNRDMNQRYELQAWGYDSVENIPSLPGCFMLMRSDVLEAVGGFDERFFLFAEDIDLSRRLFEKSRCLFVPNARIEHELRSRAQFDWRRHAYKVSNFIRYFNKWGWFVDRERDRINSDTLRRVVGPHG